MGYKEYTTHYWRQTGALYRTAWSNVPPKDVMCNIVFLDIILVWKHLSSAEYLSFV